MSHRRLVKRLSFLGVAFVVLCCPKARAHDAAEKTNSDLAWPALTAQNRPWARWWWMGSAVDTADLDRELARYQAAGLGGVEVTPIYGVDGWENRSVTYLTPAWMHLLTHAIATGKRLGMETDMTTGTGWCFGGPTVTPRDANASVVVTTQDVPAGAKPAGTFLVAETQALVAFPANGPCIDLTNRIGANGEVDWTAPTGNPWLIYAVSQKPSGVVVKRAAPGGAGPMLNPFYAGAMTRYLQWFEQPFEVKPHLRALFQDSYEYKSNWSPDFLAEFEKRRGYPLQTELPALFGTEQDDHAARVKSDYRETISDLMVLQSMPIWVRWAHAHGFLTRYQAHGAPGNLLDLYGDADIPETEMYHLDRNILISKFASSAAHVAGRNLASAETGTWLAEHFHVTLADMKYLVDDLFCAGINHVVYHGTAYSPDAAAWPGWCFYASTEMNPRNSIWHDVPALNTYIARCQSVLQAGRSDNDVLLYWPIYDRWNDAQGLVQGFSIGGQDWFKDQPIGQTAQRLWDRGFAFDYVSDRQLAGARAEHGRLTLGDAAYRAVVVPSCHLLPVETLRQLLALAQGGVTVIFDGKLPDDVPGWGDLAKRRDEFLRERRLADQQLLNQAAPSHLMVGDVEKSLDSAGVNRETMADQGLHFVRRAFAGGRAYFIANQGAAAVDGWITLATRARSVELMDPMTGRTGFAQMLSVENVATTGVYLQLDPGQSILLRAFASTVGQGPEWPYHHADGAPLPLSTTWNVKFIDGGPTLPAPFQTAKLDSWTTQGDADAFAGTALYSTTFDAPGGRIGSWSLSLGDVRQSARVRLNGVMLGTVFIPPFRVPVGNLKPKDNRLEVEVTNVSANRIRDLDLRHVPWKIFHAPNVMSVNGGPLDASTWPLVPSGLLGPVTLIPEKTAK
jgi:hypothetical protein